MKVSISTFFVPVIHAHLYLLYYAVKTELLILCLVNNINFLIHTQHKAFLVYLYCAHVLLCLIPLYSIYLFSALGQKNTKSTNIYLVLAHIPCTPALLILFLWSRDTYFVPVKQYWLLASHPTNSIPLLIIYCPCATLFDHSELKLLIFCPLTKDTESINIYIICAHIPSTPILHILFLQILLCVYE